MFNHTPTARTPLIDQATQAASAGLEHASVAARDGMEQVNSAVQHRLQSLREGTHHLRERAVHVGENTTDYIRHEPVKAVLIAAAAGAVLVALLSLFGRSHHHR